MSRWAHITAALNWAHMSRALNWLACFACLVFVLGLRDTRLPVVAVEVAPAPPAPALRDLAGLLTIRTVTDGKPIAGAKVQVFWEQQQRYYAAGGGQTDERGQLAQARVPRGVVFVIAEADGYARASQRIALTTEPRTVELVLTKPASLNVLVEDERGAPISRATVLVTTRDILPFGALSDATGRARFTRLGTAPWDVKVSAPGFESVTRSTVDSDLTVRLRPLGSIEVSVLGSDGKAVPDATVVVAGTALWPARSASTDEHGRTRLGGLLAGIYDLKATKGPLVSDTLLAVELGRGANEKVTLTLIPGRMVTALVTDGEGDSPVLVSGADVVLVEEGLSSFPLRGRTGTDGTVTLGPISPGPASLSARAPEFVARAAVAVPEPLSGPVRIALMRGGTIEGRVTDARGFPVDGASIEIVGSDMFGLPVAETPQLTSYRAAFFQANLAGPAPLVPAGELGVMPGPIPPIPGSLSANQDALRAQTAGAAIAAALEPGDPWVTREDGTYIARPVTPGRVRVVVRHPAFVEGASEMVTLAPGQRREVDLVLLAGGVLEGKVIDHRRDPVAGARVDVSAKRGLLERTTITDNDGRFSFAAVPRDLELSVTRPDQYGRPAVRREVSVEEGRRTEVLVELPAMRDAVTILTVDARGNAVSGAQVTVLSTDPAAPLRRTLFSDEAGKISVDDARGMSLRVVVEAYEFARTALAVPAAGEIVRVELREGVTVEGAVTSGRGRQAVSGATVSLVVEGARKVAMTNAEGRYRFADVPSGPIKLLVSHPSYAEHAVDSDVKPTGRRDRAFEVPAVDLEEPGTVDGEVRDARGNPVFAARVAVDAVPTYLPASALPSGMAITDNQGRFTLQGVRTGQVTVEAVLPGTGRGRAQVTVSAGRTSSVRIVLSEADRETELQGAATLALTLGERGSGDDLEIVVAHVPGGSEPERAGVQPGDVVVAIDGAAPRSMSDARSRFSGTAGTDVVLEVDRGGQTLRLRVARELVRR